MTNGRFIFTAGAIVGLMVASWLHKDTTAAAWLASGGDISAEAAPASLAAGPVYYPNCAAARVAGAAPIYLGQPGYRPGLDRDNDGIACEPYHPH